MKPSDEVIIPLSSGDHDLKCRCEDRRSDQRGKVTPWDHVTPAQHLHSKHRTHDEIAASLLTYPTGYRHLERPDFDFARVTVALLHEGRAMASDTDEAGLEAEILELQNTLRRVRARTAPLLKPRSEPAPEEQPLTEAQRHNGVDATLLSTFNRRSPLQSTAVNDLSFSEDREPD
ncbi:hypothetical protein ETB97_000432 [Aspergillus alliaceus]|uniref:Uncharacterized protein n=1 Tax=Petromyces alliaceus TaxID=209559 RepID=A0A8H6E6L1_PETAA|nr:hypothetical protein ETB97_000432 [Aspergillus burnettii]